VIGLGTESTWVQSGFSVMFSMAWTALAMRATSGLVYFMFFSPFVLTYNQSFELDTCDVWRRPEPEILPRGGLATRAPPGVDLLVSFVRGKRDRTSGNRVRVGTVWFGSALNCVYSADISDFRFGVQHRFSPFFSWLTLNPCGLNFFGAGALALRALLIRQLRMR
jgi:hypothetical protein